MKTKVVVFKTGRELQEFLKGVEYMPSMFNRKVKDSHVKNMTRSIKEIGIQRVFNIIESKSFGGVKTLYYADGQHLGKGVLNIPEGDLKGGFVAFINKVENIENIIPFVSLMNSTAKNWTLNDFACYGTVVSIEFSPLSTVELTTNWYHLHNGDYQVK